MNQEDKEKYIKGLLYEEGQRRRLQEQSSSSTTSNPAIWKYALFGLAASIVVFFFFSQLFFTKNLTTNQLAAKYYTFPELSKTRSADLSNNHLNLLEQNMFQEFILALKIKNLSSRDNYLLMHAYYNADSLDRSIKIAQELKLAQDYDCQECNWIIFLSKYRKRVDPTILHSLVKQLDAPYRSQAQEILDYK